MAYDTDDIERELQAERARLGDNLGKLRDRLTANALLEELSCTLRAHLGPLARGADQAIRDNPFAAALTAAGLAWLVFGRTPRPIVRSGEILAGTKYEALSRWEDEGGPVAPLKDPDLNWISETDSLRAKASAALRRLDRNVRGKSTTAADAQAQRDRILKELARDANTAFRQGLETLPPEAQTRIATARETAYLAGQSLGRRAVATVEESPLLTGCLALGLGAALASVLPQSQIENQVLGAERDRLMKQADDLLRSEKARAADVLSGLANAMREDFSEATTTLTKGNTQGRTG